MKNGKKSTKPRLSCSEYKNGSEVQSFDIDIIRMEQNQKMEDRDKEIMLQIRKQIKIGTEIFVPCTR